MRIRSVDANFEREPLIRSYGFKGGFMSEIWQAIAVVEADSGARGIGLGTQNVLWSDSRVFARQSEAGGNALMFALSEYALKSIRGRDVSHPIQLLDEGLEGCLEYGRALTGDPALKKTFVLNALVAVDNAVWLAWAAENGIETFDGLIPDSCLPALDARHERVISAPSIAFTIPIEEIEQAVDDGFFFLKIKLGQPGSQEEMLESDMRRLAEIHSAIGGRATAHTGNGKLPYYLDLNGRYESKDALLRLVDHAREIGALEQVALLEEPFPEELEIDVSDVPVTMVADEAAHTDRDVVERIEMGYRAIALKPIAKTLSMTFKMAAAARERGVPCFCADLTVNPILQDWNKNVAARLPSLPGVAGGLMEANGHQNYRDWDRMRSYHPLADAPWTNWDDGAFRLGEDFYERSGGVFLPSPHYEAMFSHK